jgi:hypothetical protein
MKQLLTFFFIIMSILPLSADQIVRSNGTIIEGKVIAVTENAVEYTNTSDLTVKSIERQSVEKIIYSSGAEVLIPKSPSMQTAVVPTDTSERKVNSPQKEDDWSHKKYSFTIYPFHTLWFLPSVFGDDDEKLLYISLENEIVISRYFSFACEYRYVGYSDVTAAFASPGMRIYPDGKGINGLFFGLYYEGLFGYYHHDNNKFFSLGNKALLLSSWFGKRWTWDSVHLELGTGIAFLKTYKDSEIYDDLPSFFWTGISAGIGFAF